MLVQLTFLKQYLPESRLFIQVQQSDRTKSIQALEE